jgi:hypothetical protein
VTDLEEITLVAERIKPLLAGHDPAVQGAVLADLVGLWLAGHQVPGDAEATRTLRAHLLAEHCAVVRQLTAVNAMIMGTVP